MTPSEIDAMPAGPEMDAAIAARVMCLDDVKTYPDGRVLYRITRTVGPAITPDREPVPPYSTSDAAALEVLNSLGGGSLGWYLEAGHGGFTCSIERAAGDSPITSGGPTLALAICRAALKAVGK